MCHLWREGGRADAEGTREDLVGWDGEVREKRETRDVLEEEWDEWRGREISTVTHGIKETHSPGKASFNTCYDGSGNTVTIPRVRDGDAVRWCLRWEVKGASLF